MNKHGKHIMALALCLSAAVSLCASPATAAPPTTSDQAERQLEQLRRDQELSSLAREQAETRREELLQQREELAKEIEERQKTVDDLDRQIIRMQDAVEAVQSEYDDMIQEYAMRVREIEEYGTSSYWTVLFSATSISDLLGRLDYVQELMHEDETALARVDERLETVSSEQEQQSRLERQIQEQLQIIEDLDEKSIEQEQEREKLELEAKILRELAAEGSEYNTVSPNTIYQKNLVDTGYTVRYPEGCRAVRLALRWLGSDYVWGGETPSEGGFDCSGLVYYVYHTQLGYDMHRVGAPQYYFDGEFLNDDEELQPGDLLYFVNTYKEGLSHTGIYIANKLFIHAANEQSGIKISSLDSEYYQEHYYGAKRIIGSNRAENEGAVVSYS